MPPELVEKINTAIVELQAVFRQSNVVVVTSSGGKDSTAVTHLALAALRTLRKRPEMHIVAVDTLVEIPTIVNHSKRFLDSVDKWTQANNLPVKVHILHPEARETYWVCLIGRGYIPPSHMFRWCVPKLKVKPVRNMIREMGDDVLVLMGMRNDEGDTRKRSIKKRSVKGRWIQFEGANNARVFLPILDWTMGEVWEFLLRSEPPSGDFIREILLHPKRGKLVILDLSLMTIEQGIRLGEAVLEEVFRHSVRGITSGKVINAIAVFEESQNVLNRKHVEEGRSIFVRWAKEGRKFHLGLIYVTQQPGAIAEEIVSQTDNYFVMHLLNQGDIEALQKANRHYGGVIAQFLGDETIVGNAYIYSAPHQPYIFPARVFEFSKVFFDDYFGSFDLKSVADALRQVADEAKGKDVKTVIGRASFELYKYLDSRKLRLAIMDDEKKWVDFGFAESLLRGLHRRRLLTIPQFGAVEALVPDAEPSDGGEGEDWGASEFEEDEL